jgi:hypothetical protein
LEDWDNSVFGWIVLEEASVTGGLFVVGTITNDDYSYVEREKIAH